MCIGLFAGCGDEFETDSVSVSIKADFKDKFLSEEFSIDDFDWENVERIEYIIWYSTSDPEIGFLTVYLKEHGKKQVRDAIEHFNTLDFVDSAETIGVVNTY
jgi:hypothetical protein